MARRRSFGSFKIGTGVGTKDLVTFTRLFATMIDAGLPLVQCLEILSSQQSNKHFGAVLKDIKASVEGGSSFSEALRRHPQVFDELFVNLVQAGEVGGILDSILNRLSIYLEKRQKLIRQVRGAMVYPSIVIVIAGGVMTVLLTFVIPAFEGMFKDSGGGKALARRQADPDHRRSVSRASSALPVHRPRVPDRRSAFGVRSTYREPSDGKRFFHQMCFSMCR